MEITPYQRTADPVLRQARHAASTVKFARGARTRAENELGRLWPKRPASFTPNGFPLLGEEQVYVFRTGYVFHPLPCPDVQRGWTRAREAVREGLIPRKYLSIVVLRQSVGAREMCARCKNLTKE